MRLIEIKQIKGKIKLLTGTRIGGNSASIEIGGNDQPIIRNPQNGQPYLPGSSIKGKMRSLLEWKLGEVKDGKVHECENADCLICKLFGRGAQKSEKAMAGPTRLVIRDAYLTEESVKKLESLKNRTGNDTEIKYENTINRITAKATPRNMERVPAGVEFEFNITYKVLDNDKDNTKTILDALKLIEVDGIGGGISRGNGQVEFIDLKVNGEAKQLPDVNQLWK